MEIIYFGHSCFRLEHEGYSLVIDPFQDVRGYADVRTVADMVLCSHDHFDHAAVSGVKYRASGRQNPFGITMIQTFHDDVYGQKRGKNLVHIITCCGKTLVHLGDLGHMLNEDQLKHIRCCDCLMIPVGGVYTIDSVQAWQLIGEINPRIAIPMHYRNGKYGLDNIGTLAEFLTHSNRKIAVTAQETFTLPEESDLLLVPAVKE